jgi:hypothetical protein
MEEHQPTKLVALVVTQPLPPLLSLMVQVAAASIALAAVVEAVVALLLRVVMHQTRLALLAAVLVIQTNQTLQKSMVGTVSL